MIFPLKKRWYEKIKRGEKTIEYREVKSYWSKRLFNAMIKKGIKTYCENDIYTEETVREPLFCYLQLGYKPETRLKAQIVKIQVINGKDTDLHINAPVYAIHLADVKECQ